MDFNRYKTWFFDCDGVLLASNQLKSEIYYQIMLPYGPEAADTMLAYHKRTNGVSRFNKFNYFFKSILRRQPTSSELEAILNKFSRMVTQKMIECPLMPGILEFMDTIQGKGKVIMISGGDQKELQAVFKARGLAHRFDLIFGSPESKEDILKNLLKTKSFERPAVYFGDGEYDYKIAKQFGLDFYFLTKYTEFSGWEKFFHTKSKVTIMNTFEEL